MFVVLKIPIIALLYIVWWAVRDEPVAPPPPGGEERERRRDPRHPRPPLDCGVVDGVSVVDQPCEPCVRGTRLPTARTRDGGTGGGSACGPRRG